jgi:hypothetical protein
MPSNSLLRVGYLAIILLATVGLFGCGSGPSALPQAPPPASMSPTVDLSGTWQVEFVSPTLAAIVGPYTWELVQEGATVTIYERTFGGDPTPCGEYERSTVSGNRWRVEGSFSPSNCPGFAPAAGTLSFDALASNTAFSGDLTVTLTAPASIAGTYQGRVTGTKQ